MSELDNATQIMINKCIGLSDDERMMIVFDKSTSPIAESLIGHVRNYQLFDLDKIGRPAEVNHEMIWGVKKSDVCVFMADSIKGELMQLRRPLRKLAIENDVKYIHMPKINKKIFIDSVGIDHDKLWKFTSKVRDVLEGCKKIEVTSLIGTKFLVEIDPNLRWVSSDGDFRKFSKEKMNLPGAEVFTCPGNVNGRVIVDGLISDFFTKRYGNLKENPIIMDVKGSRIINCSSKNDELVADINKYISKDENSNRIGEFAFGTNIFLKRFYNNFLVDEKFPGVHIAAGNPYPERTGADWSSRIHLDFLLLDVTASVDGNKIIENGKYLIGID
jgi:aminopeptidase